MAPPIGFIDPTEDSTRYNSELEKIRCALASARREANRRPLMSLQFLREITDEIQSHEGTPELVEYYLLMGVALSAAGRVALAENPFSESLEMADKVPNLPAELRIRVHESFGEFYMHDAVRQIRPPSTRNENFWEFNERDIRKLKLARTLFEHAKGFTVHQGLKQDTARFQLRIICVDLLLVRDPEIDNFQTLMRVAKDKDFTWREQLMAWSLHPGNVKELGRQLAAARGFRRMIEAYFVELLESTRDKQDKES